MNQPVLPVLVVGAGPTGLMMANELARHGVQPADHRSRACPGDDIPRARRPAQDPGDLRRHRRRRPGDRGRGIGVEPDHHICDKRAIELDFAGQLTGPQNHTAYAEPRTLSQHDTERILTERLSEQGVEIERGRALTDLNQDGETVTVSLRGGDGSIETVRCRWVIGCDGALTVRCARRQASRSAGPRTATSSSWPTPNSTGSCRTADSTDSPVLQGFSRHSLDAGRDRYRIFGNFPPGPDGPGAEYSEPSHEEFQAMVDARVPFPAKVLKEYWVTRYRVHSRTVPRYRDARVFLVGDAATCTARRARRA